MNYECGKDTRLVYETVDESTKRVKVFDHNDKLMCTGLEVDGKEEGEWTWMHANSKIKSKGVFRNGVREDVWKWFHGKGSEKTLIEYRGGERDGYYREKSISGHVVKEGNYKQGVRVDDWTSYHEDGSKKTVITYIRDANPSDIPSLTNRLLIPDSTMTFLDYRNIEFCTDYYQGSSNLKSHYVLSNGRRVGGFIEYFNTRDDQWASYGWYKNGEKDGKWIRYYPSGRVKDVENYTDGKKNGEFINYFDFGDERIRSVSRYMRGKKWGTETIYHENGNRCIESTYSHDMEIGVREWYETGNIKMSKETGVWKRWFENEQIEYEFAFDREIKWFENGQMKYESRLVNGENHVRSWDSNGVLIQNDVIIKGVTYPMILHTPREKKTEHECLIYKFLPDPGAKYLECSFSEEHVMDYDFMVNFKKTNTLDRMDCIYCQVHKVRKEIYEQV